MKSGVLWAFVLLAVAAVVARTCSARRHGTPPPTVATGAIARGEVIDTVDATGTVQAVRRSGCSRSSSRSW